jgi:hypothetical protein
VVTEAWPHWQVLVIGLVLLAIYGPSLVLPYYFIDDFWLYRWPDMGFPDRVEVVMLRQGRPVMAFLCWLVQLLKSQMGVNALLVVRSIAVASMGVFAWCTYGFIRLFHSQRTALVLVALLVTLPSFQMYVSAAPIFAPVLAYCSAIALMFGRYIVRETVTFRDHRRMLVAAVSLVFVWATYQAIPLIAVAMFVPLLLSEQWISDPRWKRMGTFVLGVGTSLVLYYALWRVANLSVPSDGRYSPMAIGLHDIAVNLSRYASMRLPQLLCFWDTRVTATPYLKQWLAVVAIAIVVDLFTRDHPSRRLTAWGVAVGLIVAVDVPLFFAPTSNTFSYMTSGPAAAATFFVAALAVSRICDELGRVVGPFARLETVAAFAVIIAATGLAARNVLMNHVLPSWLEYALVRDQLRRQSAPPSFISKVTIHTRNSFFGEGRDEFQWSNFAASFWAYWGVRSILEELRVESRIHIEVINADGSIDVPAPSWASEAIVPPESGRHVVIDFRSLDLHAPDLRPLHAPLPGFESFLDRRASWRRNRDAIKAAPAGLGILQIDSITSTLTHTGGSAGGERAAIDGDPATVAADPSGFHAGTVIKLTTHSPARIKGVRIMSALLYGIDVAAKLRIVCDPDGIARDLGDLNVKPGAGVLSEVSLPTPCDASTILLGADGRAAGTNFWIAEIQLLGTTR